ncbi:MAG: hypothetical protein WBA28_04910 [Microbacteriaceae bacterium]
MFTVQEVHEHLYRVTHETVLCGYIQVMDYGHEVRYKARMLHARHAKLGMSLGEYFSLEEATRAFRVFEEKLEAGESVFDTSERRERTTRRKRRFFAGT